MNKEEKQAAEERDWWRRIGKLIGATLHGWSGYSSASFVDPHCDVPGWIARILLEQADRIEELEDTL